MTEAIGRSLSRKRLHPTAPNPMEHGWDKVREKWFPNLAFRTLRAVEDRLVEAAQALEYGSALTAAITGFHWIISMPLNATQIISRQPTQGESESDSQVCPQQLPPEITSRSAS